MKSTDLVMMHHHDPRLLCLCKPYSLKCVVMRSN